MFETILFLLLTLVSATSLLYLTIITLRVLIRKLRNKPNGKQLKSMKKTAAIFAAFMVINAALVFTTQLTASTPAIRDEDGHTPETSIAELLQVPLNGRKEWISIRGWDKDKPVLLFLAGGPGGTQMAAARHELSELEKHYVVVGWDQPGSGKSYDAVSIDQITAETYLEDARDLTEYLMKRFDKEKIYLVGESWGSALGIFLIDRYPHLYHGLIGTAQMVDFAETERMDYEKAMEIAKNNNDTNMLATLTANGIPPYYGSEVTWKSAVYLNYLSDYMTRNPAIHNPGYNTFRDIFSSEYGLFDKINFFRGIINTYNQVYQQLYSIDMRKHYTDLKVPVYFFLGRYDVNAPTSLVEEYLEVLDAPIKEIVWFEHSGHSPWINERDKFVNELLVRFGADNEQG